MSVFGMLRRYLICVAALGAIVLLMIAVPAMSAYLQLTHPNLGSSALRTGLALIFLLMLSAPSVLLLQKLDGTYDDGEDDDWGHGEDDLPPEPDDGTGFDWPKFQAQFQAYARERELTPAGH